MKLERLGPYLWEIPADAKRGMRVPARVVADDALIAQIRSDASLDQLANGATLPGIVRAALAMPDIHQGYGLPVGGVVAIGLYGWLERHVSLATLMRVCLTLEVLMHAALAVTTTGWVAIGIMVVFGLYAFVWGTVSSTVRQRAVPTELQGRVSAAYMVCVFGGIAIGQLVGGVLAEAWGLTAPFWFGFVGSAVLVAVLWRQFDNIVHASEVGLAQS